MAAHGCGVSFSGDENVLKLCSSDCIRIIDCSSIKLLKIFTYPIVTKHQLTEGRLL